MTFNLPQQAYVNKFIPKSKFFSKTTVNTKLKQEFTDQILKITWLYKLAENTISISSTDTIEEIQIFEIQLKQKSIPKNALKIIDKTIPYPILYVFMYEQHVAYGITLKGDSTQRYYFSEWDEVKDFSFLGINLGSIYQGIVSSFIEIQQKDKDFATIVHIDKQIQTLRREIGVLQNKVKNEKQFNKKVVWNRQLLEKKRSLESLLQDSQ